jgi:hypothetical protein
MKERKYMKSAAVAMIAIGVLIGVVIVSNMNPTQLIQTIGQKGWHNVAMAEGDPGAGASGVLEIYVYPHQADPGTAYQANLSTVSAYGYSDNLNASAGSNIPYDTAFDIVVKCRFNTTHAYNTTASKWMDSWVRANITCANLEISSLSAMTWMQITNNSEYMWGNFYINNGGTGYMISRGESVNITLFSIQAYY